MAASPALDLSFSATLARDRLPATVREQIALVAAAENASGSCAAAHAVLGGRAGASEDDRPRDLRGDR